MHRRFFIAVPSLALLTACGGGGNGVPSPVVSATVTPSPTPSSGTGTVVFTVGQGQSVQSRRTQYVSPNTQSIVVTFGAKAYGVDFIQGSSGCTGAAPNLACTVRFTAPTGSDTFSISAYDKYGGAGNLLSQTQVTVGVVAGTNNVKAVLDGAPATANLPRAINLPEATATSVPFTVTAYDADGAAIVGPGNYTTPVALSDSDTSGGTSVTSSVAGPAAQAAVTYNGTGSPPAGASIVAQVGNSSTQNAGTGLLRVVPQYTQYDVPSGQQAANMSAASDGTLWMVESGNPSGVTMKLLHVSASGTPTEIALSNSLGQGVDDTIVGPDGALWCLTGPMYGAPTAEIVRLDASGNASTYTNANLSTYMGVAGMTIGPDNRIWFVQHGEIGAIDMSGNFTFYPAPNTPSGLTPNFSDITVGPDANLWATEGSQGGLVRITTSGTMTYFPTAGVTPVQLARLGSSFIVTTSSTALYQIDTSGIVQKTYTLWNFPSARVITASNGSVWVPIGGDIAGGSVIARVSASGTLSNVSIPYPRDPGNGSPQISRLASAADGSMWYVRDAAYGRITVH